MIYKLVIAKVVTAHANFRTIIVYTAYYIQAASEIGGMRIEGDWKLKV